jgi:hypothetical protein
VRYFLALVYGVAIGAVAILLHQSLPPVGVIASLLLSFTSIVPIGRRFGSRSYKWAAAAGWIVIILRGSTFGTGQELLVQGDGVGSSLLIIGTLTVLFAVARRV